MPIDFRIRDFLFPRGLIRLRRTLERTQWLPRDELQAYQDERVSVIVRHALTRVPYYRDLFRRHGLSDDDVRTASDLEKLPLLARQDMVREGDRLLADNVKHLGPSWNLTSGTSSSPARFALDRASNLLEFCYYWRHWSWAGYRLGDPFVELGSVHFLSRDRRSDRLLDRQRLLGRLMINSTRVSPDTAPDIANALRLRPARFLKGMASALHHLALCFEDAGIGDVSFDAIFSTGEVLTPISRATIERVLGGRVYDSYGHMERTVAISQCPAGGYHVNSDYGVLQCSEAEPDVNGSMVARVVGTSLYNLAMPLIRYDVGDDVELMPRDEDGSIAGCPCGRTLPLVRSIRGRSEDTIRTPDGRSLSSLFVLFDMVQGIRSAQIHQELPNRVILVVVPTEGWNDDARQRLVSLGRRAVGPEMEFRILLGQDRDLQRDASGKLRAVIGLSTDLTGGMS